MPPSVGLHRPINHAKCFALSPVYPIPTDHLLIYEGRYYSEGRPCEYMRQRCAGASARIALANMTARICLTINLTGIGNARSTSASLSRYVINSRAQHSSSLSIWCKRSLPFLTELPVAARTCHLATSRIVFHRASYNRNMKEMMPSIQHRSNGGAKLKIIYVCGSY